MEICAIMPPIKEFGFKSRNFRRFFPAQRSEKPFLTAVAKAAA
jgi:hypothetical protein